MVTLFQQQDPAAARRQKLAEAMMQRGQRTGPVSHWAEGLSRIIDQGAGAYFGAKEANAESDRKKAQMDSLAKAMSGVGMSADGMGPPASVGNRIQNMEGVNPEFVMQMKLQEEAARAAQAAKRDPIADHRAKGLIDKELEGEKSGFQGNNLDAQSIRILLDKSIPEDDPNKEFARQHLSKITTITTPEGTHVKPGFELDFLGGSESESQSPQADRGEFIPKPDTEAQAKNSGFYKRMQASKREIADLGEYNPVTPEESLRGLTNFTASENKQRYNQAADEWIRAKLRKESGAAIAPDERDQEYATYFPKFGDKAPVIAQKERSRLVAEEAMLDGASPEFLKKLRSKHAAELELLKSDQEEYTPEGGGGSVSRAPNNGFSIKRIDD